MKIEEMAYGQLYNAIPDGVTPPSGSKPTRSIKISTSAGDCVLCNPTYPQLRQWQKTAMVAGGNMGEAFDTLFRATCIKSGNYDDASKLIDDWGGVPNSDEAITAMRELAGMVKSEAAKT